MYQPGDYVYPTDLPRRLLCRVTQAESLNPPGEGFQVLKLTPLEGSWKAGTQLVRFAGGVRPARVWPHAGGRGWTGSYHRPAGTPRIMGRARPGFPPAG